MNRKQFYNTLENLQRLISNDNVPFIYEALELFYPFIETLKKAPENLLVESTNGQQKRQGLTNQINGTIGKEKNLNYRKIIAESISLEKGINEVKYLLEPSDEYDAYFITEIEEKLEEFLSLYESHAREYSISSCLSLSISAFELKSALITTNRVLGSLLKLSAVTESDPDIYQLDLYLSNVTSLKDFSVKLDALSEIYKELLSLYGLTEDEYPIVIEHLESGSLWVKIAGHTLTATLLTTILTVATNYYQENFTLSGQLKQLPASVKVAEDLLKITDQLEKGGVDTSMMKDNIASATRKISKKLDMLLGDQPSVEINDTKYDINEILANKLIEQSKTYKIEYIKGLDSDSKDQDDTI